MAFRHLLCNHRMVKGLVTLLVCVSYAVEAQIPVEVFAGNRQSTIDVMFFKFIKNKKNENGKFLFFNRNRASVDYQMTPTTYLPQFGFTEAISFNHPTLHGVAPVAVLQILSRGVFPRAGVQYIHLTKKIILFSWVVCETLKSPDIDLFLLFRFTPKLTEKLMLFTQLETLNSIPTTRSGIYRLTQRFRLGMKIKDWQVGAGADLNETGNTKFYNTTNIGVFLRHEF